MSALRCGLAVLVCALATSPALANFDGPPVTFPVSISQGGTGQTTAAAAITSMGIAAAGPNSDITSLGGLTTPVPIAEGGTSSITATAALASLGAAANGPNADITSLTALTTPIPLTEGGTGGASASAARANIGAAAAGANADITSMAGLTTPLPVSEGGIGAVTATQATVFAAPAGSNGAPGFRVIANSDLPVYIPPSSIVAGLPTCNGSNSGQLRVVTNALLPTLLGTLAGGGTTVTLAFCNGSAWVQA